MKSLPHQRQARFLYPVGKDAQDTGDTDQGDGGELLLEDLAAAEEHDSTYT